MEGVAYTSRLGAGLGLLQETDSLLDLWRPGMSSPELYSVALQSGAFPNMSARRLKDVVTEGFASRYLVRNGDPASWIKELRSVVTARDMRQTLLIFTARAHQILNDFITKVYWSSYSAGQSTLERSDSSRFVERANQDGKTTTKWSDTTVRRVASYLIGCCVDFGLLEPTQEKDSFRFSDFRVTAGTALVLAHELHFDGKGDNAVVSHSDWLLFGMEQADVIEQFRQLMLDGHLVVQSAGGVVNVGWKYQNMQEVIDAIGR